MSKSINILVEITENDLEEFKSVILERGMSMSWTYPSENSDHEVKITFVPAEEEKDED